jgi:signal transduction histidine kinase
VHAAVTDGEVCFEVHDSGPGIPEALRTKILEPFFTTKPRGQGTGLGLAIVQRVVRQHSGSLHIARSEARGGARFTVTMPAAGTREMSFV